MHHRPQLKFARQTLIRGRLCEYRRPLEDKTLTVVRLQYWHACVGATLTLLLHASANTYNSNAHHHTGTLSRSDSYKNRAKEVIDSPCGVVPAPWQTHISSVAVALLRQSLTIDDDSLMTDTSCNLARTKVCAMFFWRNVLW